MTNMKDLNDLIHRSLAEKLLERIRSGEATAADLNVARQYLKDNNIQGVPKDNSPLGNLVKELPFTETDDQTLN